MLDGLKTRFAVGLTQYATDVIRQRCCRFYRTIPTRSDIRRNLSRSVSKADVRMYAVLPCERCLRRKRFCPTSTALKDLLPAALAPI